MNFKQIIKEYSKCQLSYDGKEPLRLPEIATVIALRKYIKNAGLSCVLQSSEEGKIKGNDPSVLYCFVENSHLTYHYTNSEGHEVTSGEAITYSLAFDHADSKILSYFQDPDFKGNKLTLEQVWLLFAEKQDKLTEALLIDKFLRLYPKHGFVARLIHEARPSIHSLYFHVLEALRHSHLNLHKPRESKKRDGKKFRVKGNVLAVHQGPSADEETLKFGFKRNPDVNFLINYWDDGCLQVLANKSKELPDVDLGHVWDRIFEFYKERMSKKIVPLSTLKWVLEDSFNPLLTLSFEDILGLKPSIFYGTRNKTHSVLLNPKVYLVNYEDLSEEQWESLDSVGLSMLDLFEITTKRKEQEVDLPAIIFYGKSTRPGKTHKLFLIDKSVKFATTLKEKFLQALNNHGTSLMESPTSSPTPSQNPASNSKTTSPTPS